MHNYVGFLQIRSHLHICVKQCWIPFLTLLCLGVMYCMHLQVLLITLKLAMPSVLRFAVCMLILFLAFMLCGWLIFGHYNPRV